MGFILIQLIILTLTLHVSACTYATLSCVIRKIAQIKILPKYAAYIKGVPRTPFMSGVG
jgi:hypothetical protein